LSTHEWEYEGKIIPLNFFYYICYFNDVIIRSSIPPTFYEQFLHVQIQKVQKIQSSHQSFLSNLNKSVTSSSLNSKKETEITLRERFQSFPLDPSRPGLYFNCITQSICVLRFIIKSIISLSLFLSELVCQVNM